MKRNQGSNKKDLSVGLIFLFKLLMRVLYNSIYYLEDSVRVVDDSTDTADLNGVLGAD